MSVELYKPAVLHCLIDSYPKAKIKWYQNSSSLALSNNVHILENNTIIINRTDFENSGAYSCEAVNDYQTMTLNITLDIFGLEPPILAKDLTKFTAQQGKSVKIQCRISRGKPPPEVHWKRKINNSYYTILTDGVNEKSNELLISKAEVHHTGTYTCIAKNAVGEDYYDVTLLIQYPPMMVPTLDKPIGRIEVTRGNKVDLNCEVLGEPKPLTTWTKDNKTINYAKNVYLTNTSLIIANATESDSGLFSCVATNILGSAQKNFSLFVYVLPVIIESSLDPEIEVLEGDIVELPCSVYGVPAPIVEWRQNQDIVKENRKFIDEQHTLSFNVIGDMFITNTTRKHEGLFACVAENVAGYSKKVFQLSVNEPPKIIPENFTGPYIATERDRILSIPCKSVGKPQPLIKWMKDNMYLIKDSRYNVELDGTLSIKFPMQEMSGNYTCVAENAVGAVKNTVLVEIYAIPKLIQSDEASHSIIAVEGSNEEVHCPILSSHYDTVKWYKDGSLLKEGPLIFYNVSRFNASSYGCVVSNTVGSASTFVDLNVEWPPSFSDNYTEKFEIDEGSDVYFDCQVDAKPEAECKWLLNAKQMIGEKGCQLKLMNVKELDTGLYTCIATNKHGATSRRYQLDVFVRPYISDFDFLEVQLKEGANTTIPCNAVGTPKPDIHWEFDNKSWKVQNSSLVGTIISTRSSGLFKCTARNKAGIASVVYKVVVLAPANVQEIVLYNGTTGISVKGKAEVLLGSYARVACEGRGSPMPRIQWFRNGKMVNESGPEAYYADLLFENVGSPHSGSYSCIVSNDAGKEERKLFLDVLGSNLALSFPISIEPPKIFTSIFDETSEKDSIDMEVMLGQSFYLHCHPHGNPAPELYWFKNDAFLRFYDDAMVSTEFGEILVSKSATEELSGNYTCVVRNKVGENAISYLVDVLVPPQNVKNIPTVIRSRAGIAVDLSCPVEGTPPPSVLWIKLPYKEITRQSFPNIDLTDDNVTLVIPNAEVSDNGKYSCVITNKVGTAEVTFELVIEKPPSILSNTKDNNTEDHTVSLGRSAILKCLADGYPRPKVRWLRNTIELGQSLSKLQRALLDSLLTIWRIGVRDAGQYICVVENSAGSEHRRFNIRVKDSKTNNSYVLLDQSECKGFTTDRRKCHMPACEGDSSNVTGHWSVWSPWSPCSVSCGTGTVMRTRRCRPSTAKCRGDNIQMSPETVTGRFPFLLPGQRRLAAARWSKRA
ncbi:Hemicentin-1 [Eumeta japonica]|uniref:Hemolin n=1 Tax=Eumeta variegata TaxID=151549 RepID=A0A4C1YQY6_EUMVA|nr:Hemicentin-1 [Eumeta japonica]